MPDLESRDREGPIPRLPVSLPAGGFRPDGQASRGNWGRKAPEPLPGAIGMSRICREKTAFDRLMCAPEREPPHHCAGGSVEANPRPVAAQDRVRRESDDRMTARRGCEGTP